MTEAVAAHDDDGGVSSRTHSFHFKYFKLIFSLLRWYVSILIYISFISFCRGVCLFFLFFGNRIYLVPFDCVQFFWVFLDVCQFGIGRVYNWMILSECWVQHYTHTHTCSDTTKTIKTVERFIYSVKSMIYRSCCHLESREQTPTTTHARMQQTNIDTQYELTSWPSTIRRCAQ